MAARTEYTIYVHVCPNMKYKKNKKMRNEGRAQAF